MNAPFPAAKDANGRAPRRRWTRTLPWVGGGLLAVLIIIGLWPKPLPVEIATAVRGPLRVTVNEEGMTRLKHRYMVSAPVAGLLKRINLKPGMEIEAGKTVLAVLDTRAADLLDARTQAQAEAQVQAAEAALAQVTAQQKSAVAAAALARKNFERIQKLHTAGSVSQQEFDAAELNDTRAAQDERAAGFALQVAEYELKQARALLARGLGDASSNEPLVITAPISGKILKVFQESERVVSAGFPLLEVGDTFDIEARIEVLSRDAVVIKPGAEVTLHKWGGDQPLRGMVRVVEPAAFTKISALGVEEQRVYVMVDFLAPPEERSALGDSYRVEADIVVWSGESVLKVPAGALFQRGHEWLTYVVEGGRARLRPVSVGPGNGLEAEVTSGIAEGDRVVVYPGDTLRDGVRVRGMSVNGH